MNVTTKILAALAEKPMTAVQLSDVANCGIGTVRAILGKLGKQGSVRLGGVARRTGGGGFPPRYYELVRVIGVVA